MVQDTIPNLIKAKELELEHEGKQLRYIISKFPAVQGREIIAKYPSSMVPKLGDYTVNEETMLKLMHFVAIDQGDKGLLRLSTRALIDNHVPDWEVLAKIEMAMMEYNCSFFRNGTASAFFQELVQKMLQKISEISTQSSASSSATNSPRSKS